MTPFKNMETGCSTKCYSWWHSKLLVFSYTWGSVFAQMPLFATCAASAGQRVCRVHTSTPLSCSAAGSYGREGTGLFSARRTCPLHTSYRCANWKPEHGAAGCHETMRSSATNGAQFFLWQCKTIRKPVYLQTIRPFKGHC